MGAHSGPGEDLLSRAVRAGQVCYFLSKNFAFPGFPFLLFRGRFAPGRGCVCFSLKWRTRYRARFTHELKSHQKVLPGPFPKVIKKSSAFFQKSYPVPGRAVLEQKKSSPVPGRAALQEKTSSPGPGRAVLKKKVLPESGAGRP